MRHSYAGTQVKEIYLTCKLIVYGRLNNAFRGNAVPVRLNGQASRQHGPEQGPYRMRSNDARHPGKERYDHRGPIHIADRQQDRESGPQGHPPWLIWGDVR